MPAYRGLPALCPACTHPMDTRSFGDALVDVCKDCKGLWIEWFDGEVAKVARDVGPLSIPVHPVAVVRQATCPACTSPLSRELHGDAAELWRCGECAGTFVPRTSFQLLRDLVTPSQRPEPPSPLERLGRIIAQLLDRALP